MPRVIVQARIPISDFKRRIKREYDKCDSRHRDALSKKAAGISRHPIVDDGDVAENVIGVVAFIVHNVNIDHRKNYFRVLGTVWLLLTMFCMQSRFALQSVTKER